MLILILKKLMARSGLAINILGRACDLYVVIKKKIEDPHHYSANFCG